MLYDTGDIGKQNNIVWIITVSQLYYFIGYAIDSKRLRLWVISVSNGPRVHCLTIREPGCTCKANGKILFYKVLLYLVRVPC